MTERDWFLLKILFETKNITKAASVLHITQPAFSVRLRNVEAYFGTQLVLRGKKGVQFTPAGEYLAAKAVSVLTDLEHMKNVVTGMGNSASGVLRIGASYFVTKYILPSLLKRFKEIYPAVEFQVRTDWSREVVQLVHRNEVHVGFIRGNYSWPDYRHLLFREHMRIAYCGAFDPARLLELPLIRYRNDPTNEVLIERWWTENYTSPPKVGMVVDRVDTCREMVAKGLGYGFLPSSILGDLPLFSQKMVFRNGEEFSRETWLISKHDVGNLLLVKAFQETVRLTDYSDLHIQQN